MPRSERSQSTYCSTSDADSAEGFGKMSYRDRLRLRDRILSTHSSLREGACDDGGGNDDDDVVRRMTFFHTILRTDPATFDFIGEEGKFIGEDDDVGVLFQDLSYLKEEVCRMNSSGGIGWVA